MPQFLRPEKPLLPQIATLGLLHLLTALTVLLSYGLFAAQVRATQNPWFARSLYGVSGSMLIAAGAGLASLRKSAQ